MRKSSTKELWKERQPRQVVKIVAVAADPAAPRRAGPEAAVEVEVRTV